MASDKDSNVFSKKDTGDQTEKSPKESEDFSLEAKPDGQEEILTPQETESEAQDNTKLRQEIEKMDLDDSLKSQVSSDATNTAAMEEEKKLKNLLGLAQKKGIVYAVKVAQDMDDPYLLDKFHDLLIEKGYYKEFTK